MEIIIIIEHLKMHLSHYFTIKMKLAKQFVINN